MDGDDSPAIEEFDPFSAADPSADVNEAAEREWTASTTAFERVEAVLRRTTDWHSAGELADRARVSEPTARKHLTALAESGHAETAAVGTATRYRRNPDQRRLERIQHLADEHPREQLEAAIRGMKSRIRDFEGAYDATSPEELVGELDADDEQGWDDVSRWKTARRNLAFAKTALSFKETRSVDSMSTDDAGGVGENA